MLFKHLKKINLTSQSLRRFSTSANNPSESSISLKFHEMYVKELQRIEKNS